MCQFPPNYLFGLSEPYAAAEFYHQNNVKYPHRKTNPDVIAVLNERKTQNFSKI